MPDGSFPEVARSSPGVRGREGIGDYQLRRRRPLIGGFEPLRTGRDASPLTADVEVETFGKRARSERGMQDRWEVREKSERWFGWARELSTWIKDARVNGQHGFTDQLWQAYAHRFPGSKQMSLSGIEQIQWDEALETFFYANPVFRRVYEALGAVRRDQFSGEETGRLDALQHQLVDLKRHLAALDRASFRGFVPGAEDAIIDLQRRLEEVQRVDMELRVRREVAEGRGERLSSQTRGKVISEHRRTRLQREYSAETARKELAATTTQMHRAGRAFKESLLALQLPEKDMQRISLEVSNGTFSSIESSEGVWSRMKQGWKQGGFFRALRDTIRPSQRVLMERALAFYDANQRVNEWRKQRDAYTAEDQQLLRRSPLLN